jgi:hypothetical protein
MDTAVKPRRDPHLEWSTLDEGGLIVDPRSGETWSLNPVGLFLWDHCDGEHDLEMLEEALCATFEVEPASARSDIEEFLLIMQAKGLVGLTRPMQARL